MLKIKEKGEWTPLYNYRLGNFYQQLSNIKSDVECKSICLSEPECNAISFIDPSLNKTSHNCLLFRCDPSFPATVKDHKNRWTTFVLERL